MTISFARHQFPPAIIRHAVWLYVRFTLSYRDVEDLLAERGLDISYETVRRWVLKFGPLFARELRRRRPRPTSRWHLDEMAVTIAGRQFWLWRAVEDSADTTARAQDAAVQIARISPALPVPSCRRSQHVQRPASSHIPPHASRPKRRSVPDVASRHRGLRSAGLPNPAPRRSKLM
jgi:hypothetical protein